MLKYLKKETNTAYTENGAASNATTYSDCLDLFATAGGLRSASEGEITSRFLRAYAENPELSMKLLFFARDVRGGLGERRFFRVALRWLSENHPGSVRKNVAYIAEYGRWDDLLSLLGTPCEKDAFELIKSQLSRDLAALEDSGEVSLLAKWLPSVNASNAEAVRLAKKLSRFLGMTEAEYRKALVRLRERIRIIENNLRERDYTFDYSKQPSRAMYKYRKAFLRNDGERYEAFLDKVEKGEAELHTGALTPYDIVAPFFRESRLSESERRAVNATWRAQEDFTGGENALVVVDGSGSMYFNAQPLPAAVAESLAIYFAERNTGRFRNCFITFSENPRLVELKGGDVVEKLQYCMSFNEVANTSLQRVFELILNTAVKNRLPQSEMPSTLYIISDMEFDRCTEEAGATNFEYAKRLFSKRGYVLPRVVFWNVASRRLQQPVTMNEAGVTLVSGCTPRIFDMLKSGKLSPYAQMLEILGSERYAKIAA